MRQFINIARYEFSMSTRRAGYWIAYVLLGGFYLVSIFIPSWEEIGVLRPDQIWPEAGHLVFMLNIFTPLLAGILAADRMQRDFRSGVSELQRSSPLSLPVYLLAKYLGVLGSALLPILAGSLLYGLYMVVVGHAPLELLWPILVAFLTIAVPSHAFVVAFSLVCPLVIPLRVYQVLFTGYWFWGNMISPKIFPTISETILNAIGQYPLQAYFGMYLDSTDRAADHFTTPEALLNLAVLTACIACVLIAAHVYLRRQAKRA